MKKTALHIIMFITGILLYAHAYAGFPIGKFRHVVVVSYIYGTTNKAWDSTGTLKEFSNNGRFTSNFFSTYFGYGLTRKVDIFVSLPFVSNAYRETNLAQANSGFGDLNVGMTYYIEHFDYSKYLSISVALIAPMYTNNLKPYIGYAESGVEGKFNFSGYSKSGWKNTYYDLQFGGRRYNTYLGPTQVFASGLFGFPTGYRTGMNFQVEWLKSFSNDKSFNAIDLQLNRDFTYVKGGINFSYRINPNASLYFNIYSFLTGKNTGQSTGASLSTIFKF